MLNSSDYVIILFSFHVTETLDQKTEGSETTRYFYDINGRRIFMTYGMTLTD